MKSRAASFARLALVLPAVFAGLGAARFDLPGGYRCETEHYLVQTDVSQVFSEVVGRHMEAIYQEYSSRFAGYGQAYKKFNVVVFRQESRYEECVPPDVRGSAGVFVSSKRLLAAHTEGRTREGVLRTLYHEGFHQFMYEVISKNCPTWLNEGLAEYFYEATWNGESFSLGQVPSVRLATLQQAIKTNGCIRFRELFQMNSDAWIHNCRVSKKRAGLIYSESWGIVHFLLHAEGGRYVKGMNHLLKAISEGENQEKALEESFGPGLDLRAFEEAWVNYVMSLKPSAKFQVRGNMEVIMLLARRFYNDPRRFDSLEELRRGLLAGRGGSWELQFASGEKLSSDQKEKVAALFHSPYDQSDSKNISYILLKNQNTGMPVLVCDQHPGVIIKAYYYRQNAGEWKVKVEEEVRELASPQLKQGIMARMQ